MDLDLILFISIITLPIIAQIYISYSYNKNSKKEASNNLTGFDIARKILDKNGLNDIIIIETGGTLTDHYDPSRKVIRLSKNIYHGTSIASNAVAAHEVGHAIQDKEGYTFMRIRSVLFPIVNLISTFSYYIIILGFILEITNLIWIGIVAVSIGVIFQIITLPVEINASKRAQLELDELALTTNKDKEGIKNMLTAAALTYVAGVLASILQLLRLIGLTKDN